MNSPSEAVPIKGHLFIYFAGVSAPNGAFASVAMEPEVGLKATRTPD